VEKSKISHEENIPISKSITAGEIAKLPLFKYQGEVRMVTSKETLREALLELKDEKALGFDTESRPAFRKGVSYDPSLIQLASSSKVFIFQLCFFEGLKVLVPLLTNPKVLKVGIAIQDDLMRLRQIEHFEEAGFVEITNISEKLGITNKGLRGLVGLLLGYRISKGAQLSNWARKTLTEEQIKYAATDARMSREIYFKLMEL